MEKSPISIPKEIQERDALLVSLAGGVIGIIGAVVDRNVLSQQNPDIYSVINSGEATVVGAGLFVFGLARFAILRRSPTKGGE